MTEQGSVVGPPVCNALKKALGDHAVACEGVKYSAGVTGNMIPGGDPVGVNGMKNQAAKAVKNCPQSNVSPNLLLLPFPCLPRSLILWLPSPAGPSYIFLPSHVG